MDQKLCEICSLEAKLVCFCRKALLCEMCIGKHFLDEPSLPHKPIALSQTDIAKIYEERHIELRGDEERLIGEAHTQHEIGKLQQRKVAEAIEDIASIDPRIDTLLATLTESVCKHVRSTVEQLKGELKEKCAETVKVLKEAANGLQDGQDSRDNPVLKLLAEVRTLQEVQRLELLKWKLETDDVHVADLIRKAVRFSIDFTPPRKLPHAKTLDSKRTLPEPSPQKSKTLAPGKKTVAKPDPRTPQNKPQTSQPKAQSSAKKQPQVAMLACPKKDQYGRRSTAFEFNPFPLLPDPDEEEVKSDEDFNLLADEEEIVKPSAAHGSSLHIQTAREPGRVKTSPLRSPHPKSPSVDKGRPSKHKDMEMSGIGKGKRPGSDQFVVHRSSTELKGDEESPETKPKMRLAPPTISITPPEGDHRPRTPRRSISEDTSRQLVSISKATEVSRSSTQFSPAQTPPKSSGFSFPQQTYIIPPGGNVIKVLDLDANTTAVKEFSLPATEHFGEDLAWCCSLYGEVFLLGGRANEEVLNSIYFYNPGTDELEGGCSMMTARYRHCVLYHQDSIYILGGIGASGSPLKDCERFDIRKKAHKRIGAMSHARDSHSACIHEGKIYVCGGTHSEAVEVMVPQTESFSLLHLKVTITGPAAIFAEGDKIVVIHSNLVTHLWPGERNTKDVGRLSEYDWWCQGPAISANGMVYFIKKGTAFRFDPQRLEMEEIPDV